MTKNYFQEISEINTSETENGTVAVPHFLKLQSFSTKKDFSYLQKKVIRNFLNYKFSTLGSSIQHYSLLSQLKCYIFKCLKIEKAYFNLCAENPLPNLVLLVKNDRHFKICL